MHEKDPDDFLKDQFHHLIAMNRKIYDDNNSKESIIKLNNNKKDIIGSVTNK